MTPPSSSEPRIGAPTQGRPRSTRGEARPAGPVISRSIQVLGAFRPDRTALTLTEIARVCGLPLSSAHRIVGSLAAHGMLERDGRGAYHIGLRLWELGSLAPRGLGLREASLPFMEDLFEVTHENVQLAVRDGLESVYVERIAGRAAVPVQTRVGGRWPLHPTGVGRVLLAYAPADIQAEVLGRSLEAFTRLTITDPEALRHELAEVRRRGYAVNDRQIELETLSVAAPIRGRDGAVVAALSVVVRAGTRSPDALAPVVQATARGISRALSSIRP